MTVLQGIRIIELAESVAGEYCGKLLADFGAEVIKVERPGLGSPTRAMAPIVAGITPGEGSGLFAYLNTNKQSLTLNLALAADRAVLHRLIGGAAVVIDDHDEDWQRAIGIDPDRFAGDWPGAILCAISGFGRGAPADLRNATSGEIWHASGWGYHSPSPQDEARPPLKGAGRFLADFDAAIEAAIATMAALVRRERTGDGEVIDIAKQGVLVGRNDTVLGAMLAGERATGAARGAFDHKGPSASFACSDGFVYLFITSAHWAALLDWMGQPDWAGEFAEDWLEFGVTDEAIARFRVLFAAWIADKPKDASCQEAQQRGIPLVQVNDAADLYRSEQFRHRGFFQTVAHPLLGSTSYPTVPYKLSATPARLTSPAPLLGQHDHWRDAPVAALAVPARAAAPSGRGSTARGGPLAGIRVLEITKVWAGPYAGKLLAFLGAEVIKVESMKNLDEMRAYGGVDIDNAPIFMSLNPEILSVQVNMKSPEGMEYLRQMIAQSDIVLNNIKPGAMERAGLGYEAMRAIRPDLISVSLKMNGNDGPLAYQTGFAPSFAALGGMNYLVGYDGEAPRGVNMSYGDSTAGAALAYGALAALMHRERTGEGQFVDVSAVESMASLVGDSVFEYALTGRVPGPDANRHADMAPHGAYPCLDGEWLSISVATETQWRELVGVLGASELASDPRFATLAGRQTDAAALDAALGVFTARRPAAMLAAQLRQAGVPAHKSMTSRDVVCDPRLWERGLFRTVRTAAGGLRPIVGPAWHLQRAPVTVSRGAPNFGEHNRHVYCDMLGLSADELEDLKRRGIAD